jgi:hypothetical protein
MRMRARQQKPKDASELEQLLSGDGRIDARRRGEWLGNPVALIALAVLALTASPGSAQAATPTPLVPFAGLYIYPKDGASYSQQATDYYECDVWAVKQTGFDPTLENG